MQTLRMLMKKSITGRGLMDLGYASAGLLTNFAKTGKLMRPNTTSENLRGWSRYDWKNAGEEWTPSSEWKEALISHVLEPNVSMGSRVLEIGPGAGRWTESLVRRASHLTCVDLTPECIQICETKFKGVNNITFVLNDGKDLSFLPPHSIDCVWSFDVFVHIQPSDIEWYLRQLSTILAERGRGIIHHAKAGAVKWGWRSDMTDRKMVQFCNRVGLKVLEQFDSWDDGKFRINPNMSGENVDTITIFAKTSDLT